MSILEEIQNFSDQYGKTIKVDSVEWRYYRLGTGSPILWLTGGLRRAAPGYAFLVRLSEHHTVIAPDYPPVQTIAEFLRAFDAILQAEGVQRFTLGGQSYGGLLAQAYLAWCGAAVEQLILSSTSPANYGKAWLAADYLGIALARWLPERQVKRWLAGGLLKVVALPETERDEWQAVFHGILENELTRADVISHFGVAADWIRKSIVTPAAYRGWTGRVIVLSAADDPTQSEQDFPKYERLFGRPVEVVRLGQVGHAAALVDPEGYVKAIDGILGRF